MTKKILVVEDTPDLLQIVSEYLTMEGFKVTSCLSAFEAMESLTKETPDLVITDLSMPDMDGFQLIEKIRESNNLKTLPIIIFSARPILDNQARASDLGVLKYIKKPCSPEDLVVSIKEVI